MRRALLLLTFLPLFAAAQLNGYYVIDPGGAGDYTTLALAVSDLNAVGVSGPTTFAFEDGSHNVRVTIHDYAGDSPANRVTITSRSGNAAAVTLQCSGVGLGQAGIMIVGLSNHISITDLTIDTDEDAISDLNAFSGLQVERCILNQTDTDASGYGIRATGSGSAGNIRFRANTMNGFGTGISVTGASAAHAFGCRIEGNVITSTVEHAKGISVIYTDSVVVADNEIELNAPIPAMPLIYTQGLVLSYATGPVRISGNRVVHGTGGHAFEVKEVIGSDTHPTRLENNMVVLTHAHSVDFFAIYVDECEHLKAYHNSCRSSLANEALVFADIDHIELRANILHSAGVSAAGLYRLGLLQSDQNVFYSAGGTAVAADDPVSGSYVDLSLADWQTWGYDAGALYADPLFVSPTDLHLTASSPAIGLARAPARVSTDIDGDPRPGLLFPQLEAGADELDLCGVFRGTYRIGTSVYAQYATFGQALSALYQCGVGGPVVFEVEPGTYTETLNLNTEIPGASTLNTVTFRGQTLDSTDVTLTWPSGILVRLITLNGTDHIAFEHMTFQRGTTTGTELVSVNNSGAPTSFNIAFRNVRFMGVAIGNNNNVMVRSSSGDAQAATYFERCAFNSGQEAIKWSGAAFEYLRIADCTFDGWLLDAVQVTGMGSGLEIVGNSFTNQLASPGTALMVFSGNGAFVVERNNFRMSGAGSGGGAIIRLDNCVSPVGQRGRIVNNMLLAWDRVNVRGIEINGTCTRIDILHNSVSVKNTNAAGAALFIATGSSGSGCEISNNIFHARTSYTVSNTAAIGLGTLRRNLLHTTHASLAHWGGVRSNLTALQTASGQFNNSIQAPPLFVDNASNLHITTSSPAVAAGFVFSSVVNDFDGQSRPGPVATNPDIGADEIGHSVVFSPRLKHLEAAQSADRVFPNPANEQITIITDEARTEGFRLLDLQGRTTLEGILELPGTLDITAVAPGTYLLMLGNNTSLTRIIVQH